MSSSPGETPPGAGSAAHRLTIRTLDHDPRATAIARGAAALGLCDGAPGDWSAIAVADIVFVVGDLSDGDRRDLEALLVDPLLQSATWSVPDGPAVEVMVHPGVRDTGAEAVLRACRILQIPVVTAATGRRVDIPAGVACDVVAEVARRVIANEVIERWSAGPVDMIVAPSPVAADIVDEIDIVGADDVDLERLDIERGLHLDPAERRAIRDHFRGLGRNPTDAELETFAQTWSEHCAHKTFRARLTSTDGTPASPLLEQLRRVTDEIAAPYVRSAFVGNAGVVAYRPGESIALKAETHNHPSAVEPFGGANTGVGGVIRDVLGIGHRPVALTDVLCFGPPDLDAHAVPAGILHPRRIRDGVVAGVADYGNKMGLATIAGAVLYDPGYVATPLVFCGCIGIGDDGPLPLEPAVGDRVVMIGGRTGRDGIGGATFSSGAMDASSGVVAGARVQIGDPITEKLVADVLAGSRHLYRAITDCGAGGLSSAVGELADPLGADIDLARVPLKYPGLRPWEIWLSEAQERMVLAVDPAHLEELSRRCGAYGVEICDLGAFTGDGRLVVRYGRRRVVDLELDVLHRGRPQRSMVFEPVVAERTVATTRRVDDPLTTLERLLAHRNLASKAAIIARYDHEIGGATRVRPLTGVDGDAPSDGVVLVEPGQHHGLAIGIGVNPWYGLHDPEAMGAAVVDEALRSLVAVGADPDRAALLDNFSWGDPRRARTLGELVAAVAGCCRAARAFGAPFVSGKDSLNNEYRGDDGRARPVPPTLVITAVAPVPDSDRIVTTDPRRAGDLVVLLGWTRPEFAGSHLDLVLGAPESVGIAPQFDESAPERYRQLHRAMRAGLVYACHDVSEGGLGVALAEMVIGGGFGIETRFAPDADLATLLFAESTGRLVVEIAPEDLDAFCRLVEGPVTVIGELIETPELRFGAFGSLTRRRLGDAHHRRGSVSAGAAGRR